MNPILRTTCNILHISKMCVHTAGTLGGSFIESGHFCTSLNDCMCDQDVIGYCWSLNGKLFELI
jgi:hypothetical protein